MPADVVPPGVADGPKALRLYHPFAAYRFIRHASDVKKRGAGQCGPALLIR